MGCRDMRKVKWGKRRRRQEGVERRMKKLQRLVPGGAGMNPDRLFLKTAEHILQLRIQLNVLQALSKVFNA
ncbi:transcription factor PAR2-like [Vigna unguiculata]|uniref:Myc-type n=1 Tax=Vigna unguiculata TaxID=3917 RepID=A0A4D6L179_VIGUN|nr:transcription factor PAR2-like [Vigna unguiculata]QCD82243.1 Myc-type [Vigna unguiculata]